MKLGLCSFFNYFGTWYEVGVQLSSFALWISSLPFTLCWKTILSPLNGLSTLVKAKINGLWLYGFISGLANLSHWAICHSWAFGKYRKEMSTFCSLTSTWTIIECWCTLLTHYLAWTGGWYPPLRHDYQEEGNASEKWVEIWSVPRVSLKTNKVQIPVHTVWLKEFAA